MYIKAIADLEDFMNETIAKQKVSTKKMNATNARGLNAVKQRIRKNNKDYATEIDKYREDKADYMMSDEEDNVVPVEKTKKSKTDNIDGIDGGDDEGFSTVGKGGKTLQYTPESIFKHLRSIIESRGKKNTDRAEQIRVMERLLEVATTPYQNIRVLLTLMSTRFDLTSGSTATTMSQEQWKMFVPMKSTHVVFVSDTVIGLSMSLVCSWKCSKKTLIWLFLKMRRSGKMMRNRHNPLQGRNYAFREALFRPSRD